MVVRAVDGSLRDDLVIPQGSYWPRTWSGITDSSGNLLNLAGWAARAVIRQSAGSPLVLFEWNTTTGPGIGAAALSGNSVTITLVGTDSAAWTFTAGVYDLFLFNPAGQPTKLVGGSVRVTPSITH